MMKRLPKLNSTFSLVIASARHVVVGPRLWQKGSVPTGACMLGSTLILGAMALASSPAAAAEVRSERPPTPAMSLEDAGAMSIWTNPANLGFDPDPSSAFFYAWSPDGRDAAPRSFTRKPQASGRAWAARASLSSGPTTQTRSISSFGGGIQPGVEDLTGAQPLTGLLAPRTKSAQLIPDSWTLLARN